MSAFIGYLLLCIFGDAVIFHYMGGYPWGVMASVVLNVMMFFILFPRERN